MNVQEAKEKAKILLNLADNAAATAGEKIAARLRASEIIRKYNIENLFESQMDEEFNEKTVLIKEEKDESRLLLIKLLNEVFTFPYSLLYFKPEEIIQIKVASAKDNFSDLLNAEFFNSLSSKLETESIYTFFYCNRNITNNRTRRPGYKQFFCGIEIRNFKIKLENLNPSTTATKSTL